MTTATPAPASAPAPQRPAPRTLRDLLMGNPVVLKELRGRMRGWRAFIVLSVYLFLMSGFVFLLYLAFAVSSSASGVGSGPNSQEAGKIVFFAIVGIELLLVCFIAPAFTSGSISGEKERQTFDLLRATLLSARAFVLGKLTSALSYILLLLFAALPLQSLALLLGGVAPEEILLATVMLICTAFLFGTSGIFFSSIMNRTLGATVLTYAFALLANLGLPLVMLILIPFGSAFFNFSPNPFAEGLLVYTFSLLIVLNPLATAIATEVILTNQHTLFYFTTTISSGVQLPLISPWLPYCLICLFVSFLFILGSIGAMQRPER